MTHEERARESLLRGDVVARLRTLAKRLNVTPDWECGHGVPLTRSCRDCGAGAVWSKREAERLKEPTA